MKRKKLQRIMAWVMCAAVCATSAPAEALAANIGDAQTMEGQQTEETVAAGQDKENQNTDTQSQEIETEQDGNESDAGNSGQKQQPAPQAEVGQDEKEPAGEAQNSQPQIQKKDAVVRIAWSDEGNLAGRRQNQEGNKYLKVYADGKELETQPRILLESSSPEEKYGIQTYTYVIKDLPLTGSDGEKAVSYTVKESVPGGYAAFTDAAFTGAAEEEWQKQQSLLAAPAEEIKLTLSEDGSRYQGDKSFGNYLPAYQVSGSITWKGNDQDTQRPHMESYFKNQFSIVRDGDTDNYTAYKLHYAQDEQDADKWNYTVKGLFATREDGSKASYIIGVQDAEGYDKDAEKISITESKSNADVVYSSKTNAGVGETDKTEKENQDKADEAGVNQVREGRQDAGENKAQRDSAPVTYAAVTLTPSNYKDQILSVLWVDSTEDDRPAADSFIQKNLKIQFTVDGKTYDYNKNTAGTILGIEENAFKSPVLDGSGTGTYQVYKLNVPTQVKKDGGTVLDVAWSLTQSGAVNDKYLVPEYAENREGHTNVWINREKDDSSFIVEIKDGDVNKEFADFCSDVKLYAKVGDAEKELGTLDNLTNAILTSEAYREIETNISKNEDGTFKVTFTNLPVFNDDKVEIIYYMKATGDELQKVTEGKDKGDYYKPSYDNQISPNFGSNIVQCHDGGTMNLTLMGKTEYTAEKIWLDDGAPETIAKRPAGTLYLWRYTDKGPDSSYRQASQVTDGANKVVIRGLDTEKNNSYPIPDLEKYDPEGYPYAYLTREILTGKASNGSASASYEQVYLKSYDKDQAGITGITEEIREDKGDKSVYNQGILANRIKETTPVLWKKIWRAANYQNDLDKVEVTLTLWKKSAGNSKDVWTATDTVFHIKDFTAEKLIQSGSVTVDKYDELGLPLEYQWLETGIKEGAENVEIDKNGHFQLSHNKENLSKNGKDYEYYVSTVKTDKIEDPESGKQVFQTTVTNQLKGTTTYTVDKLWAQLDADGQPRKDEEGKTIYGKTPPQDDASVTVTLYQDNNSTFTWEQADGQEGSPVVELNKGINFTYEYLDLPKYDESGTVYNYLAKEKDCSPNWHVNIEYDVTDEEGHYFDCQMKNSPVGVGKTIFIRKEWLDDGDETHRESVKVAVYRKKQSEESADQYFGTFTLTKAQNWRAEINVSEYTDETHSELKYKDLGIDQYYIREVGIGNSAPDDVKYDKYSSGKTYTPETAANPGTGGIPAAGGGAPENKNTIDQITASHHIYEAYYDTIEGELAVVNRRIGTLDMEVTKKWLDGNNENNTRPNDVQLVLKANGDDGYSDKAMTIQGTDSANDKNAGKVKVNGVVGAPDSIQIQDKEGNSAASSQTLSTEDNKTYYFCNLPKYDAKGRVLHYTVEERNLKAPYSPGINDSGYDNGDDGFSTSSQRINVTNRRTGTKSVIFNKLWKDVYNYQRGLRPDIYVTLYKTDTVSAAADNVRLVQEVTPYPARMWTHIDEYKWTCTFDNLPKYDENGAEIKYYATEGAKVNMEAFDYQPVEFYSANPDDNSASAVKTSAYAVPGQTDTEGNQQYVFSDNEGTGGFQILPENGWFVNRIGNTVTIQGKKVWKNVPSGFPAADFPQLTIKVDRTTTEPADGSSKNVFARAWDAVTSFFGGAQETADPNLVKDIAETTDLKREDGTNNFKFSITEDKSNNPLPKYNDKGEIYFYSVREEVTDTDNLESTAYEKLPGEVNDFIITNVYDIAAEKNKGSLSAEKTWAGISDITKYQYPAIEFKLYRQYVSKDADLNIVEVSDASGTTQSKKMTKPEFVETKKLGSAAADKGTVTWDDLRIYAPNGNLYYYYIEEVKLNGYEGGQAAASQKSQSVTLKTGDGAYKEKITFKNTYKPLDSSVTLNGTKVWEDYSNNFSTRPSIDVFKNTITVYRYADAQSISGGGAPAISEEEITVQDNAPEQANFIEWLNTDTDTDRWEYTITNLERYAPNSMPWKYIIKEKEVTGYTAAPADGKGGKVDSAKGKVDNNTGNITMPELKNSFYKKASITKKWNDTNAYNLRPTQITVKLQFKLKSNGNWQDATLDNLKTAGFNQSEKRLPFETEQTVKASASGSWGTVTESKLPSMIGAEECFYRFVETKMGAGTKEDPFIDVTASSDIADNLIYNQAGAYRPSQAFEQGSAGAGATDKTTITNTISKGGTTSLKVTKKWEDSDNEYNTRPLTSDKKNWEITVKLQRAIQPGSNLTLEENDWKDVLDVNGGLVTEKISDTKASSAEKEVIFSNLPLTDGQGNQYYYRAIETTITDGYKAAYVHIPAAGNAQDTTVITNSLDPVSAVKIQKIWKNGNRQTLTFEIKKVKEGKEISFETPKIIELDGTKDSIETSPWQAEVNNLPTLTDVTYVVREVTKQPDGTYKETVPSGFWKQEATVSVGTPDKPSYKSTITNIQTEFALDKADIDGISINNRDITLGIYSADGTKKLAAWHRTVNGTETKESVTPEPGTTVVKTEEQTGSARVKGLPQGTYVLREEKVPAGYEKAGDIIFTLGLDGDKRLTLTSTTEGAAEGAITDNSLKLTMKDQKISLKLIKQDITGTPIEESNPAVGYAEFTVKAVNPGSFADGTTEKSGITAQTINTLDELWTAGNSYTFTETKAPAGYIKSNTGVTVKIKEDGTIETVTNTPADSSVGVKGTDGETLIFKNMPIEVTLEKADALTGSNYLQSAKFSLKDITSDQAPKTVTVDINGKVKLSGTDKEVPLIQKHTYKLTETEAPDGYELRQNEAGDAGVTFTVEEDGTVTFADGTDENYFGGNNTSTVRVKNDPIEITLHKADSQNTADSLAGAMFKLEKRESNNSLSTVKENLETDKDGNIVIKNTYNNILLSQNTRYVLTETKAPAGYVLTHPAPSVEFTVNPNGTAAFVTSENGGGEITGENSDSITITNRKTKLYIEKQDNETSDILPGAELEIYAAEDFDLDAGQPKASVTAKASWISAGTAYPVEGLDAGITGKAYVLYEKKAPSGYDSFNPLSFTLKPDNTVEITESRTDAAVTDENKDFVITIKDTRIRGHVKLQKTVAGGTGDVKGIVFDLYRQTGNTPNADTDVKIAENLLTNENGIWSSEGNQTDKFTEAAGEGEDITLAKGLPAGKYYLTETQATADTVLNSTPHFFTIEDSNTGAHGRTEDVRVQNAPFAAGISFKKLDEKSGEGIEKAAFELKCIPEHKTEADQITWSGITDENGDCQFAGLPKGEYTLTETAADGYDLNGTHDSTHLPFKAVFTIGEQDNGTDISINETNVKTENGGRITLLQGSFNEKGITNARLLGSVTIYKADGDDTAKALNGVEFKLMKKAENSGFTDWLKHLFTGKEYQYQETAADEAFTGKELAEKGKLIIKDLDWGTYKLVETTAKDGYSTTDKSSGKVLETMEFTIDRYGRKDIELETNGHAFYNYRTILRILKQGLDGTQQLSGAQFTLTGKTADKNGTVISEPQTYTTDGQGRITLDGILIGGETYALHETKAPAGYELASAKFSFRMEADGTVTVLSGDSRDGEEGYRLTAAGFFDNAVTVGDTPIQIRIAKSDEEGKAIDETVRGNAEFTVIPSEGSSFADNSSEIKLTTAVDQRDALFGKLIGGNTYILKETKAPKGYILAGDVTFTVDADGEITVKNQGAATVKPAAEGSSILVLTVKDTPVELDILKTDDKGNSIGDAVRGYAAFKVEGTFAGTANTSVEGTTQELPELLRGRLITSPADGAKVVYTLTETKAPGGYLLPNPAPSARFAVAGDGSLMTLEDVDTDSKFVKDGVIQNTSGEGRISISIKDEPITVSLTKKDVTTGEIIAGRGIAEFDVAPAGDKTFADGSTEAIRVNTGADGMNPLTGKLIPGTKYSVKEIKAPAGYRLADAFEISVSEQGLVVIEGKDAPAEGGSGLTVKDEKTAVKLRKISTESWENANPDRVPGAEFQVKGTFAGTEDKVIVVTDAALDALEGRLIATTGDTEGKDKFTYTVHEVTAPAGYELAPDFTFTVDEHGAATVINPKAGQMVQNIAKVISGTKDAVELAVADEPVKVTLVKTDAEDKTISLEGAEFAVTPEEGSVFADGSRESITVKTDKTGTAVIPDDIGGKVLKQGNTYKLTETKAPKGYILTDTAIHEKANLSFLVNTDGTVTFTDNAFTKAGQISGNNSDTIYVADAQTEFNIRKVCSENENSILDAHLQIYEADDFRTEEGEPKDGAKPVREWDCENKSHTIKGLETSKTYVLYESAAPAGHDSILPVQFQVKEDNHLEVLEDNNHPKAFRIEQTDKGIDEVRIVDVKIRGQIELQKSVDGKAGDVENVMFDLYRQMGDKPVLGESSTDVKIAQNLTTDQDGKWTSKDNTEDKFADGDDAGESLSLGLPTGKYYFLETKATADTVLAHGTPVTFVIENSDTGAHDKLNVVEAVNKPFAASVSLVKLDEKSGEGIGKAAFELECIPEHKTEADKLTWKGITDEKGTWKFTGLPKGEYTLTEIGADGYDLNGTHSDANQPFKAAFTIGEGDNGADISIDETNVKTENGGRVTLIQGSMNKEGITNARLLGSVTIYKADGDDTAKALNGVEFKLMKKVENSGFTDWLKHLFTGKEYQYQETAADQAFTGTELEKEGKLTIKDLDWGTYKLVETTAKDGYSTTDKTSGKALETVEFTIDRYGRKDIELETNGHAFCNYQTLLEIHKAGTDGSQGLAGAEFTLTGKTAAEDGSLREEPLTVTTDTVGRIILKGTLIGGEQYTLHETKAPEGYEQITNDLVFTVEKDGSITAADGAVTTGEGYVITQSDFFGNVITAVDTPVQAAVVKKDAEGKDTLRGAEFEVVPKEGSRFAGTENAGISLTDANMADGLKGRLIAGHSYILTETKAPAGYEIADAIELMVDADGKVSVVSGDGASVTESAGIEIISVRDNPIRAEFLKRMAGDIIPEGISGAVFSITPEKGRTFADGTEKITFTSGTEAEVLTGKLVGGDTYTIAETKAPDGAMPVPDRNGEMFAFTFTVDEHGVVQGLENGISADSMKLTYEQKNDRIIFWDEPTTLQIFKKDMSAIGSEEDPKLASCSFEVTGRFAPERYRKAKRAVPGNTAETIIVTTTGEDTLDNALKGRLIVGETYTIREIAPPDGFELGLYMEFQVTGARINAEGKQALVIEMSGESGDKGNNGYWVDYDEKGNPVITQRDEPIELKLRKTDAEGNILPGAVFDITGIFAGQEAETTREFTADEHGEADLTKQLVESGENAEYIYRVQEKTAPDGYVSLKNPLYFKVVSMEDTDGKRRAKAQIVYGEGYTPDSYQEYLQIADDESNKEMQILSIANERALASVSLIKLDEDKNPVRQGVAFTLQKISDRTDGTGEVTGRLPFGDEEHKVVKTVEEADEKGAVKFAGLTKGTYVLEETSAAGYDILQKQGSGRQHEGFRAVFTISEDDHGKVIAMNQDSLESERFLEKNGNYNEEGILNTRLRGSVVLHKADGVTKEALTGAVFKLLKKDEESGNFTDVQEGLMTEEGLLVISGLDWGTYKLAETKAKDGYSTAGQDNMGNPAETVESEEFTIHQFSDFDNPVELMTDGHAFYNYQTKLRIRKTSTMSDTGLAGAQFTVEGKFAGTDEKTITLTTGSDGTAVISGRLIGGESYTLRETKSPAGYDKVGDELVFVIGVDGKAAAVKGTRENGAGYSLTESGCFDNLITVRNAPSAADAKTPDKKKPVKTQTVKKPSRTGKVKTGDESNVLGWMALLLAAGTAAAAGFRKRRNKKA